MGLMFRRRRPVARLAMGAATAGVAYHAGRRRAEQDVYNEQASAAYDASQSQPAPVSYTPPPAAAPTSGQTDLDHLVALHAQGALTDEEFSAAKRRLLGI